MSWRRLIRQRESLAREQQMTSDTPFVLLRDDPADETLVFADPAELIIAHDPAAVFAGLARIGMVRLTW